MTLEQCVEQLAAGIDAGRSVEEMNTAIDAYLVRAGDKFSARKALVERLREALESKPDVDGRVSALLNIVAGVDA